jgi:hypothetical protein
MVPDASFELATFGFPVRWLWPEDVARIAEEAEAAKAKAA